LPPGLIIYKKENLYVLPFGQMSLWGKILLPQMFLYFNIRTFFMVSNDKKLGLKVKIRSDKRIGPNNIDILSIIFGSLLGDASAERHGNGTRINFYQEGSHKDYLLWLHSIISNLSYTNPNIPKLTTRLGNGGKMRLIIRFKTFTFSSFNWIHDIWYLNNKKVLPDISIMDIFLTPIALAIWIMDYGSRSGKGLKLATNNFTSEEVKSLCLLLNNKYYLNSSVSSAGYKDQYLIYMSEKDKLKVWELVKDYIHPSMKYKFNL
jgi:ubiquinol-cytochrome c reductase cytochrome b subunit